MDELFTRHDVRSWRSRAAGRVALVPTMGSLHPGHMRLVEAARRESDTVIVSLFVNPLQFGPDEDYAAYPRDYAGDRDRLAAAGVDALFAPSIETVYPRGPETATVVDVPGLTDILDGPRRPGHFRGVASVVVRLFNLVVPDRAWFGEKDFQQLAVIRRMAHDLAMGVVIRGVPVEREADGLARSSRNAYLDADQRERALAMHHALCQAADELSAGNRAFADIERAGRTAMEAVGFQVDYFEVRAPSLDSPAVDDHEFRVLAAGWLGQVRLIDNVANNT